MTPAPKELSTSYPVFRCHVQTLRELEKFKYPSPYFILFLAADFSVMEQNDMVALATKLISKGNANLCAWGDACANADTNWDIAAVESKSEEKLGFFTMTTWHEDDTLEEAAWYALNCSFVDEHIWDQTSIILATVAETKYKEKIQAICDDPIEFNKRLAQEE